ncbi:MAG: hypothetical protein ACHQM6_00810 [Candidatus Kapaibacterium sp.]
MIKGALLFLGFFTVALLVYCNGFHIPYFYDDYEHIFFHPSSEIFKSFFHANAYAHFYRPFERSILAIIQTFWQWNTFPIRIFHLFLHSIGAYFVYHVLRTWKVNALCSFAGALFLLVSQLSVYAVASNDSQSQIEGALFSAISLWLLYRYLGNRKENRSKYYLSLLAFFLALVSKETSAGLLLGIPFVIFAMHKEWVSRVRQTIKIFLPYGICFGLYFLLRIYAGAGAPSIGNSGYTFYFGINIFRNAGLLLVQAIVPISSLSIAQDFFEKDYFRLGVIVIYTAMALLVFGYGLWKSERRNIIIGLCVLIFCSWIPVLFLNATNELYPYNMVLYLGALFGISAEYYFVALPNRARVAQTAIAIIFIASLLTNIWGTNEKTSGMKELGDRAAAFLPQIISIAPRMPHGSTLYLVNPKTLLFEYSQFSMRGFRVIAGADSIVKYYSNRADFQYDLCDSAECISQMMKHTGIAFTYDVSTLQLYPWHP